MAQDIPTSVGWLIVTAEGITALADSIDTGDAPDSRPMLGTIDFTASLNAPIVAIAETPTQFISMAPIKCEFDGNGIVRPPRDGSDTAGDGETGGVNLADDLRIVAPDQPGSLSVFGWTWTATFKPSLGQKWRQFSVNFGGAPNDNVNLADEYAKAKAASAGAFSPMIRKVPGPYTPGDPLPADVKPGMYVLDESTGDIYLVADDSTAGFFASIKGAKGDAGDMGPAVPDTGERDMSGSLVAGLALTTTYGTAYLRRIGSVCYATFHISSTADGITSLIGPLPPGFGTPFVFSSPGTAWVDAHVDRAIPGTFILWYLSSSGLRIAAGLPNPGTLMLDASWRTSDAFPTVLPGTPA